MNGRGNVPSSRKRPFRPPPKHPLNTTRAHGLVWWCDPLLPTASRANLFLPISQAGTIRQDIGTSVPSRSSLCAHDVPSPVTLSQGARLVGYSLHLFLVPVILGKVNLSARFQPIRIAPPSSTRFGIRFHQTTRQSRQSQLQLAPGTPTQNSPID